LEDIFLLLKVTTHMFGRYMLRKQEYGSFICSVFN